jgi:hypothetical protein
MNKEQKDKTVKEIKNVRVVYKRPTLSGADKKEKRHDVLERTAKSYNTLHKPLNNADHHPKR